MDYGDMSSSELLTELESKFQAFEMTDSEAALYILVRRLHVMVEYEAMASRLRDELLSMPIVGD